MESAPAASYRDDRERDAVYVAFRDEATAVTTALTPGRASLAALALAAFAANSLLCRLALAPASIDAVSFTAIRLAAGAAALLAVLAARTAPGRPGGTWTSAVALTAYALSFSLAYLGLATGTGALLLFGAVQATMLAAALWHGERLDVTQWAGVTLAIGGVAWLVWPGVAAPPPLSATSMIAAGVAWGVYSLRGRSSTDAVADTAGNFLRAVPLVAGVALLRAGTLRWDAHGAAYAVVSGALTSGLGYVAWYAALRALTATRAATLQLSVPVLAAAGGVAVLAEPLTTRLATAAVAVLGGILVAIRARRGR